MPNTRVITCNVNGIRAAVKKGFDQWVFQQNADVICLQEVRCPEDKLPKPVREVEGYHAFHRYAEKPGYSGVSIYVREDPVHVVESIGYLDEEARYLEVELKDSIQVCLYLPSGSSSEARQDVKYVYLDHLFAHLKALKQRAKPVIISGDWNIAHQKIDIKNWRSNQKNSGFLPEERAWFSRMLEELGYVDTFRELCSEPDQYTWWSNRGQAYANNVGWRIDYQIGCPKVRGKAKSAQIFKDIKFSDHAPIVTDYAL